MVSAELFVWPSYSLPLTFADFCNSLLCNRCCVQDREKQMKSNEYHREDSGRKKDSPSHRSSSEKRLKIPQGNTTGVSSSLTTRYTNRPSIVQHNRINWTSDSLDKSTYVQQFLHCKMLKKSFRK